MTESKFVSHTPESAPEGSSRMLAGAQQKFGFVPAPVAKMASSPELLATFQQNLGAFDKTSLTAMEREVVVLTMATFVECHYCVAMHSTMLAGQQAPEELIEALRAGEPLQDARLEAIRKFALAVLETKGGVADQDIDAFFAAKLHPAERPRSGAGYRHVHHVDLRQPADPRRTGRAVREVPLGGQLQLIGRRTA
ncbi:hypothetical protein GCM10020000_13650 [Streptomyces olivoverticillatus]